MSDFKPIPRDALEKMIGKAVHLSWGRWGTVWILDSIDGDVIKLHTPKTGKPLEASASEACYSRKHEPEQSAVIEWQL